MQKEKQQGRFLRHRSEHLQTCLWLQTGIYKLKNILFSLLGFLFDFPLLFDIRKVVFSDTNRLVLCVGAVFESTPFLG